MKTIRNFVLLTFAGVLLAACQQPAANNAAHNANANANTNANANHASTAAMPTKEELVALERKAFDAWKNKDTKYFENFLAANFVAMDEKGAPVDRASLLKMIGEHNCDFKDYKMSEERVTPAGPDAVIITTKIEADYTCGGEKGPSPVIAASVYTREGSEWKGAYHNEVPIIDPKTAKPSEQTAKPAASATDELTTQLMALEKQGWEAWKARDAAKLNELVANDLVFVDWTGRVYPSKAEAVKTWSEHKCEVGDITLGDGRAKMISKDTAILTFHGTAAGTCEGQPIRPLRQTSVYVKDGTTWKPVYIIENPA